MKKILIVKTSSIGDVLHCFPLLPYLKEKFPLAEIDWVVEKGIAPLLRSHPLVNEVIEIDTKSWRKALFTSRKEVKKGISSLRKKEYDLLLDLQGNTKSSLFTLLAKSKRKVGFGRREVSELPNLLVTNEKALLPPNLPIRQRYLALAKSALADTSAENPIEQVDLQLTEGEKVRLLEIVKSSALSSPRLLICFGSNWQNKRFPFEVLEQFLEKLEPISPSFLFCGGSAVELEEAKKLTDRFAPKSLFLGRLSFPLWQQVMANVDGIVAMDSGSLHLAATTKTPCFSFFGPTASSVYVPNRPQFGAFQGSCPYSISFEQQCPKLRTCPTGACLRSVEPQVLADAFLSFWKEI